MELSSLISQRIGIAEKQVSATMALLDEKATIPFIARYRKERTGGLDEVQIASIHDEYDRLLELIERKQTILSTIEEQGKLTPELKERIDNCWQSAKLEDIYLPYKPHRKTRADIAREQGLEPLAKQLMAQRDGKLSATEEQLQGARDIIVEWISQDERARNAIRREFTYSAVISSKLIKGKEEQQEAQNYKDYFDCHERLSRISSHRLLAIRRGEKEGFLRVDISPDNEKCLDKLAHLFLRAHNPASEQVEMAMEDSLKRLLKPSIETEFAAQSKEKADTEAIQVFAQNLRQLLLASPLGQKRVLALDPGFRTGCKMVCLSAQGALLHHEAIFPHPPVAHPEEAKQHLLDAIEHYQIQAISIGNGTASRETEAFVNQTIANLQNRPEVYVVSENGASIYSASQVARDEFPNEDVTVRGAVSIGRRLMDPLAELVKIDPKSIGVGQYQHDVDQKRLRESLQLTVESVVNHVGVDVNTASPHLLTYISGLGPTLADNIVTYRTENGPFPNRKSLLKVPKMGAKTFEQAAGFLRVTGSDNPLDNSAVHPECYAIVQQMAKDLCCEVNDLMINSELRKQIVAEKYTNDQFGLPTIHDILHELEKPSRDPREQLEVFHFDDTIHDLHDLRLDMVVPGIVTNITNFGAFVDIGIHKDGLVHISEMANRRIANPQEVVHLHQHVRVRVLDIDPVRGRIQLSMKGIDK